MSATSGVYPLPGSLSQILGGGSITPRARTRGSARSAGLAYNVYAQYAPSHLAGLFLVVSWRRPRPATGSARALAVVREELIRLRSLARVRRGAGRVRSGT